MEGYKKNAAGHLVPLEQIQPIDLARDELVVEKAEKIKAAQEMIRKLKAEIMGDIEAFVSLAAQKYDAQVGGQKGNVTLMSFDGRYKLRRQISENLSFDERLQAAKALIDECIHEWSEGSCAEIRVLINDAFQVDKQGNINTTRVLGLRRLDISHPKWQQAMTAIGDSLQVAGTKAYLRLYQRKSDGGYEQISLDVATL